MKKYNFYGWERADIKDGRGLTPRDYYDLLSDIWCAKTCAPRMRDDWSEDNKTLGQCSITAFLMQDIYGGKVFGVPLESGNYHCYNVAGDCVFDLTSEQFGGAPLDYQNSVEQFREVHFKKEEKKERYEYLKEKLAERSPYILETERLILRPWYLSDAEECFRYSHDGVVGDLAGWKAHETVEDSKRVIKEILAVKETYAIVLKETGLPIGSLGLHFKNSSSLCENDDECELGYWVGVPYWNRGIATEAAKTALRHAFFDLGIKTVWCGYFEGNSASKRVQEKLGFTYFKTNEKGYVSQTGEMKIILINRLKRDDYMSALK